MAARIERPSVAGRREVGASPLVGIDAVSTRRRSRISEIVIGVVVVLAFGLGVVLWHASTTHSELALVLTRPVRAGETLPAGSTVVAAALVPGQFASFGLRPGQAVDAIRTADAAAGGDVSGAVLARATVFEIRPLEDTAHTWIVSLLVPESDAASVASAAAAKSLALALVPGAG